MRLPAKLLRITLLDVKTKDMVVNEFGDEPDVSLVDTEQLRKVLGCPMKTFNGEYATVAMPLIKAAQRKLEQEIQTVSNSNQVAVQEARNTHEAITELLSWMKEFPNSVFEIV